MMQKNKRKRMDNKKVGVSVGGYVGDEAVDQEMMDLRKRKVLFTLDNGSDDDNDADDDDDGEEEREDLHYMEVFLMQQRDFWKEKWEDLKSQKNREIKALKNECKDMKQKMNRYELLLKTMHLLMKEQLEFLDAMLLKSDGNILNNLNKSPLTSDSTVGISTGVSGSDDRVGSIGRGIGVGEEETI